MTHQCTTLGEAKRRVQRRRDLCVAWLLSSLLVFAAILVLLALHTGVGHWSEGPVVIVLTPEEPDTEPPDKPERFDSLRPPADPSNRAASRARMIEAVAIGKVALPTFDRPVAPVAMVETTSKRDFGLGIGEFGRGGAGGGFFGIQRDAQRFVFVLDFSTSMNVRWDGAPGDVARTRLGSLKSQVVNSIIALPQESDFAVIFFTDDLWTLDDPTGGAFRGAGGHVAWRKATQDNKFDALEKIEATRANGGTEWLKPLLTGLDLDPKPEVLYLLSDGEPSDWDELKRQFLKIKMQGVAIDTIALESSGSGAGRLKALAKHTGGSYRRIQRGQVVDQIDSDLHKFRPQDTTPGPVTPADPFTKQSAPR